MPASVSFSLLLRVLGVKTTSLEARATPPSPRAPARTRPPRGPQPARSAFRALDHADGCGFARHPVLGHTHRAAHSSVPRPSASPDKRPLGSRPPQPSRSKGLSCSARTRTGFPATSPMSGVALPCASHVPSSADAGNPLGVSPMAQLLGGPACSPAPP